MPIIKSAKKALRQSQRRTRINLKSKRQIAQAIKIFKKKLTAETLQKAISEIDKAVKKNVFRKNKGKRLKLKLNKLLKEKHPASQKTPAKNKRSGAKMKKK